LVAREVFAQTLGYDVVEAEGGHVAITVDPTGAHLNPWGAVHGGLTATLLDSCMGSRTWLPNST
jgi:acyl-coenzyme A thioesterase PaaI-like protein